ncbi:Cysteine sulfinic acid decarboxylase [Bagarius yarrelli]|uniref:Cysteine sulfinic acid decarboxylase n=1 Tax=Bagarius yarrelli TaxID=175774 RepID=A0A556U0C5_BAGYA|nr:Cysteine sulfinic acid decarboxylase [Bagarius yarrelli]
MNKITNGHHHVDETEPNPSAGEQFLSEAFKVILDEAVRKATDVKEKLFAGVDYHALTGRLLTETLNTSQYTYEVAPVFVLMEEVILRSMRSLVGWSEGDGIFCPGGSISNMYAMNVARYWAFPQVKTQGLWSVPRLAVFTSQESHYSLKKSAAFLGIGTENVYHVKVDESGRMIPEDLEAKIVHAKSQGAFPFFVNATAGSTVQGAFDPLERIADISESNGMWMHVDAVGTQGLADRVDKAFANRRYLVEEMKKRAGFQLVSEPQFVNVCFWFVPPSLRGKENDTNYQDKLAKVAPLIKERMVKGGTMMVGYQPLDGRVNFFRMVILSPHLQHRDMDFFLDEIERLGKDL